MGWTVVRSGILQGSVLRLFFMLGIIKRRVSYKSAELISKLYRSYVRPHLDYCIHFWSPINVKDGDMVEEVQRKATKMI